MSVLFLALCARMTESRSCDRDQVTNKSLVGSQCPGIPGPFLPTIGSSPLDDVFFERTPFFFQPSFLLPGWETHLRPTSKPPPVLFFVFLTKWPRLTPGCCSPVPTPHWMAQLSLFQVQARPLPPRLSSPVPRPSVLPQLVC